MDDDLNTTDAITAIFNMVKLANSKATSDTAKSVINAVRDEIIKLSYVLGIEAAPQKDDLAEEVEKLIEERQAARKAKNFARADEIRDELLSKGIILEDTREGVKWKRA